MDEEHVKKCVFGFVGVSLFMLLGLVVTGNETFFKVVLSVLVLFGPLAVTWYMNNTEIHVLRLPVEIRRLREKIQDYRPGNWTIRYAGSSFKKPSKVKLGVFGVQDSGKSAFLNSLHFAYKGVWEQIYIESNTVGQGGETNIFRYPAILTDQVTTFDTRGLSDMGSYKAWDVMDEITGKRGIDPRSWTAGERIDCPIFILKYNPSTGIQHYHDFLSSLVPKFRQDFGSYPIMVVTFANSILNQKEIVSDITRTGMEKKSLFFTENYTASNHEMDPKKHIALLKILEACIKRADDNITFHWQKENEYLPKRKFTTKFSQNKKGLLKLLKENFEARFKQFKTLDEAQTVARSQANLTTPKKANISNSSEQPASSDRPNSYRTPKPQQLNALRFAIEKKDKEKFRSLVWGNPRLLVTTVDTPTTLHVGCKYNALHVAAMKNLPDMMELILETISDPEIPRMLYPGESEDARTDRWGFLTYLYLNSLEKGNGETPLHFASKFGFVDCVSLLLGHPKCNKQMANKYGQTASEIICNRYRNSDKEKVKAAIAELLDVPDQGNIEPIKKECCKTVGADGGKLQLESFGIELEIPPGAIDSKEEPQEISLCVLADTPNLGDTKEEMSVCFGVQCLVSDDLVLRSPVTFTIPHCAVATRYSRLEAVLYTGEGEYTPDAEVMARILLRNTGLPNCIIERGVLRLQIDHFSWIYIKVIKNLFFRGKQLCCLPFAEKPLPEERMSVIMRVHLFDDLTGEKQMVVQEEQNVGFARIHPATEIPINVTEEDVTMTCFLDNDRVGEAIVEYDDLWRGKDRMASFKLDLTNQPDRVIVDLEVGQNGQRQRELPCVLKFASHCRSSSFQPHDIGQVKGATGQTPLQQMEAIPQTTGRVVTNGEITKLSRLLPDGEYSEFCEELGFDYNYTQKIKTKHLQDSNAAFKEVLQEWKNRGGLMVDLDTALKNSDLGGLIREYKI